MSEWKHVAENCNDCSIRIESTTLYTNGEITLCEECLRERGEEVPKDAENVDENDVLAASA